jgi:hypothetical protein
VAFVSKLSQPRLAFALLAELWLEGELNLDFVYGQVVSNGESVLVREQVKGVASTLKASAKARACLSYWGHDSAPLRMIVPL